MSKNKYKFEHGIRCINTDKFRYEWCFSIFGEYGIRWAFTVAPSRFTKNVGENLYKFKNKEDAIQFMLTWNGTYESL